MIDREQNVLALLYEERVEELTPAYLAYRLRIASAQAVELLDSLVRSGTLDLYFDADGNISYGLPSAERERLARHQPVAKSQSTLYDDPALEAHFFGNVDAQKPADRHNQHHAAPHYAHQPAPSYYNPPTDPNGYDGTIGEFTNAANADFGYAQPPPAYQHYPQQQHQPQQWSQQQQQQPRYHTGQYATYPEQPHPRVSAEPHYITPNGQMVPFHRQPDQLIEVPHESNPSVAAFLSFLVVGGGQWYNGEYAKGAWMFIGCAISWLFLMGWIVTFWSIIDAYAVAKERRSLPR